MLIRVMLSIFCLVAAAAGAPVSSLYFFGDSLTDTGNIYQVTSTLNAFTFGIVPVYPDAPYSEGRFTNGPVWAEYVAERYGHPEDAAPAGMSLGVFGEYGLAGNNYAIGGARTDFTGGLGLFDLLVPTGMSTQVDYYLSRNGGTADSQGLYFLLGGGNDLRDASRIADPAARAQAAQRAFINIAYSVQDLYLAGARQFVLINSPDVGLLPETIGAGLTAQGTDAAITFNQWMSVYSNYLSSSVPGLSLNYFDLFGLHRELTFLSGIGAVKPCEANLSTCDTTLFFDNVHPTAWVHEVFGNRLADQLLGGSSSNSRQGSVAAIAATPEPSTALLTISAAAILIAVKRRRSAA